MIQYSIVYLRPDGWWEAGSGWNSMSRALRDGLAHDWGNIKWGIAPTDKVNEERLHDEGHLVFKSEQIPR